MTNETNEIQIRTLIETWAKAVRERDINGILAHHARDIVMFDVPPPFQSKRGTGSLLGQKTREFLIFSR